MKKIPFFLSSLTLLGMLATCLSATRSINSLPIGSVMPKAELKVKDVSGKEISLGDIKKKKWFAGDV